MNHKKITQIRIQKEVQSIQKQPIPSVILQRQNFLHFHFCFYNLEEQYKLGFYHGLLQLPEDYPFSPPKIVFLTNNGRFQVGKSICTTFTHYHKQTWSSSWNIRTILTAMISFMYSNERGIGGVFQTPQKRRSLASKSLQQNLKNQKFVELFKDKLIQLKLVSAEHIEELMRRSERNKRRKREHSETTHVEQVRQIPQILQVPQRPEELEAINQQKGSFDSKNKEMIVNFGEVECLNAKRRHIVGAQNEDDEIAQLQLLEKKRKLDDAGGNNEEMDMLERKQTVQGLDRI